MAGKPKFEYVVGNKAISAGGRVHLCGKVVTQDMLKVDEKVFEALIKRGEKNGIFKREIKEPEVKKEVVELTPLERYEKISDVIKAMHDKDGKQLNKDNFTDKDEPRVAFIEAQLKDVPGFEKGIAETERDAGLKLFKEALLKKKQS